MDRFERMTEEKIRKAYEEGAFDHLPGAGKPLPPDSLQGIPDDLKMAYRMMKNAGFSPDEMNVKKEIMSIEDLIRHSEDKMEKDELKKELNQKLAEYNRLMSKKRMKTNSSVFRKYQDQIEDKFLR
ncbi:hypothetical protein J14TS2_50770 [Bacillus sp. J14TS2]|uniref:DnaJ family domain-containing protein n=1 Tax=unclassified Bacillus (in: firmicutes) TaxID=185979 RepID=UPI001A95FB5A|nr:MULTISPECIES: DUF1992 domain-containing protein [unclassified Bacillus (in: firmicutes)]MBO0993452.1 DUF1992 domain-containing protein [Bacillus sp. SD088]GIN74602.1 hypothetical protein J14TS2_50770 [Bacillus sp. J14TS2]